MSIYRSIEANVVNIEAHTHNFTERILVDTNVLLWFGYPNKTITQRDISQATPYLKFINESRRHGSGLYICELLLSEVAHVIEKTEFNIFNELAKGGLLTTSKPKTLKEFRLTPELRGDVVSSIETAWSSIRSVLGSIQVLADSEASQSALDRLKTQSINGYDLFILECMKQNKVDAILTDDGGFCTVPNITLYTANQGVLVAAQQQGKLLT